MAERRGTCTLSLFEYDHPCQAEKYDANYERVCHQFLFHLAWVTDDQLARRNPIKTVGSAQYLRPKEVRRDKKTSPQNLNVEHLSTYDVCDLWAGATDRLMCDSAA